MPKISWYWPGCWNRRRRSFVDAVHFSTVSKYRVMFHDMDVVDLDPHF